MNFGPVPNENIYAYLVNNINIPVIALCGPIGCGKTFVSQQFRTRYKNWKVVNFADKLRQVIELVYGIPADEQKDGKAKARQWDELGGKTLRFALQHIATQGFRTVYDDTWIICWLREVFAQQKAGAEGIIVEDCRFFNEHETVTDLKLGYAIYVQNPATQKLFVDNVNKHYKLHNQILRKFGRGFTLHESELSIHKLSTVADSTIYNSYGTNTALEQLELFVADRNLFTHVEDVAIESYKFYEATVKLRTDGSVPGLPFDTPLALNGKRLVFMAESQVTPAMEGLKAYAGEYCMVPDKSVSARGWVASGDLVDVVPHETVK